MIDLFASDGSGSALGVPSDGSNEIGNPPQQPAPPVAGCSFVPNNCPGPLLTHTPAAWSSPELN